MQNEKSRKRNQVIAWMLLLVGMVMAVDGLLQLIAGNAGRMGEASIGGFMMILSAVFFAVSRKKPDVATPVGSAGEEEE